MTRDEHLLQVAQEEAAELIQRLVKAARFGLDQIQQPHETSGKVTDVSTNPEGLDNRERIIREYLHLIAAMEMLGIELFSYDEMSDAYIDIIVAKREKVARYIDFARAHGTITD